MQPMANAQQAVGSNPATHLTVEPSSKPIEGSNMKTELQPSAPATLPAKMLQGAFEQPTSDIGLVSDAEAGASLIEVMPMGSSSSTLGSGSTSK